MFIETFLSDRIHRPARRFPGSDAHSLATIEDREQSHVTVPDSFPGLLIAMLEKHDGLRDVCPIHTRGRFRDSISQGVHGEDLLWYDRQTVNGYTSCLIKEASC